VQLRKEIICVECGGTAHLLQEPQPDAGPEPGDWVAYRCSECAKRWDIMVEEEDAADFPAATGTAGLDL
jgi:DNA-directed RNA polymerase subunit RPC12/RpoP